MHGALHSRSTFRSHVDARCACTPAPHQSIKRARTSPKKSARRNVLCTHVQCFPKQCSGSLHGTLAHSTLDIPNTGAARRRAVHSECTWHLRTTPPNCQNGTQCLYHNRQQGGGQSLTHPVSKRRREGGREKASPNCNCNKRARTSTTGAQTTRPVTLGTPHTRGTTLDGHFGFVRASNMGINIQTTDAAQERTLFTKPARSTKQ